MLKTYSAIIENSRNRHGIHSQIQRMFHTPDQKEKCPVFKMLTDDACLIRSNTEPIVKDPECILGEHEEKILTGHLQLEFLYAAVYHDANGQYKGFSKDEDGKVVAQVAKYLMKAGFCVNKVSYRFLKLAEDTKHRYRIPYGKITADVSCYDPSAVERIMLNGIGHAKYLGLGYVVVRQIEDKKPAEQEG